MIDSATENDVWKEEYPKFEGILVRLVTSFRGIDLNNHDDLLQEARISALLAVRNYDDRKEAKLTTYVFQCVLNRFRDLRKMSNRKIELILSDDEDVFENVYVRDDHEYVMKDLLNSEDHEVYTKSVVLGYSDGEIIDERQREMGGNREFHRREIKKCLLRILHQYKSTETSQNNSILSRLPKRSGKEMLRSLKR